MRRPDTRTIVEMALSIALASVLGTLKLLQMPNGGEVSLAMLPLFVLAIRRGPVVGVTAGALYGSVDAILYPAVVHPAQFLLDYPVAYGLVGLAGAWAGAWRRAPLGGPSVRSLPLLAPAVAVGALGRYAAHVVSGLVFFGEYAPEGQPVLVYSLLYNLYVWVSAAVCLAAAAVVLPVLAQAIGPAPDEATVA